MSEQRTLAQKLLSVQKNIGAVSKSAYNPHFKSKFADLNEVLDVAKAALNAEGIFITQGGDSDASGGIFLRTALIDADSGQTIEGKVYLGQPADMQKMGASITYARRFGLVSLLALESEEDDGETAVGRGAITSNRGHQTSAGQPQRNNDDTPQRRPSGHSGITIQAPKVAEPAKPPVGKAVSEGPSRKTVDEKISLTSKVIIDSKRATQDQVVAMLAAYGVKNKSELNDDQARKLLTQLEEILNQ